jgi:hypothetical protein
MTIPKYGKNIIQVTSPWHLTYDFTQAPDGEVVFTMDVLFPLVG